VKHDKSAVYKAPTNLEFALFVKNLR